MSLAPAANPDAPHPITPTDSDAGTGAGAADAVSKKLAQLKSAIAQYEHKPLTEAERDAIIERIKPLLPFQACHDGDCKCGFIWSLPADVTVATTDTYDHESGEGQHANPDMTKYITAAMNDYPQLLADLAAARVQVAEMRGERDALRLALDKIEPFGAIVIDKLRHYGFVFKNAPAARLDTADEAVKWENMAFSLYTDIADMSSLARAALEAASASADGSGGGSG